MAVVQGPLGLGQLTLARARVARIGTHQASSACSGVSAP